MVDKGVRPGNNSLRMYRTSVIVRHTFKESIVQPIYSLLIALGSAILLVFMFLPFFTLSEDTVMFKSVGLDIIRLFVLISTLFATSKSIFEEIEDRTMLTLMSKPVTKFEVLLGKYLGIIAAAALAVAILGIVLIAATYWRIPGDYLLRSDSIDDRDVKQLQGLRLMHVAGLVPALTLDWMMISVLAAVGVAISTRVSLVVNLPVVIFVYIAGNLTRFLFPHADDTSILTKFLTAIPATILPYLEIFDVRSRVLGRNIAVAQFAAEPLAVPLGQIWAYVALAAVYGAVYVFFTLMAGMWLFQNRELGGAEG